MTQWFYRITQYADELLKFDGLDWPERVRVLQTNWIGRSEGAEITFPVEGHAGEEIRFFTTRPDTIYGATFMVLAPEHPLVAKITAPAKRAEVEKYVERARNMAEIERTSTEREKTGVDIGAFARNVFTGERIPIYVADYVLATLRDRRDHGRSRARRARLRVREEARPGDPRGHQPRWDRARRAGRALHRRGRDGPQRPVHAVPAARWGRTAVAGEAKKRGIGGSSVTYRVRDWLISRQRYWGTPIPIVHCETDGAVPVPYDQLPDRAAARRRVHRTRRLAAGAASSPS